MSKLPDFEGLALFAKVAEERSYAGAARAAGVSVATVSRAVSRLEERLGGRLFNRTSRQLALTEFGLRVVEGAARSYREAEAAEDAAREIADVALQLKSFGGRRSVGHPMVTILTVCPGLRIERALVSRQCAFERASLLFGDAGRERLHRKLYIPTEDRSTRALAGSRYFMPDAEDIAQVEEVEFVRLVKLAGSRDLDRGVASGDFSQIYDLVENFRSQLEDLVAAVGLGSYLVLGGGLSTPPLQAVHSILVRELLARPERRPRLALVPAHSASHDPLRQLEVGRIERITKIQGGGFDRIQVVQGNPLQFLRALKIAFSGAMPKQAA